MTSLVELLSERLTRFIACLADFKYHLASEAILPDYQCARSSKELSDPWIAVSSPLLLFAACERLYMMMDHLEGRLGEMLRQVAQDLERVCNGLILENEKACRKKDSSGVEFSGNGAPLEVPRRDQNIEAVRFESALEALRQLGRVVKADESSEHTASSDQVRLQLLDIYHGFFATGHQRQVESSLIDALETITGSNREVLNHPTMIPLIKLLDRELNALSIALKVEVLRTNMKPAKHEAVVSSLLDFRTAQAAWEGHPAVQLPLCRRMQVMMLSVASTLPHVDEAVPNLDSRSGCTTPAIREDQHKAGISKRCTTRVSGGMESSKGRIGLTGADDSKTRFLTYTFPSRLAQVKGNGGADLEKVKNQQGIASQMITYRQDGLETDTLGFVYSILSSR